MKMTWDEVMRESTYMKKIIEEKIDREFLDRDRQIESLHMEIDLEINKVKDLENALLEGEGVI